MVKKNLQKKSYRNKLIIFGSIILILIFGGLFFYNKHLQSNDDVLYTLTYDDMGEPGSNSKIEIYNDKVEITTTRFCSALDCESTTYEKSYNYSKENMNKLKKYIKKNFSKKYIELSYNELTDEQYEVIQGVLLGEGFFEIAIEEYKYKIEYTKDDNLTYIIYFKNNNSILVKKLNISEYDITNINTYSLKFSKKGINKLNDYIKKEVKEENSSVIYKSSTLRKDEINIFKSIEENDESYLTKMVDDSELIYTISYNGINCPTPVLYLYSDNSYEFYYTFSTSEEELIPKTGTYNYDITKIIKNIDKYEENKFGPYTIKEVSGKDYITYNTNTELQEFLNTLDITLEMCLEQQ